MKNSINVKWDSDMKFVTMLDGHVVVVDADNTGGGHNSGPRPKVLLMVALAGCTGMDVISILKKMQVNVLSFNLRIEADICDEHPKKYEKMKIIYEIGGKDIDYEKVKKAVTLSLEKYCGVFATLKEAMPMEYEIVVSN